MEGRHALCTTKPGAQRDSQRVRTREGGAGREHGLDDAPALSLQSRRVRITGNLETYRLISLLLILLIISNRPLRSYLAASNKRTQLPCSADLLYYHRPLAHRVASRVAPDTLDKTHIRSTLTRSRSHRPIASSTAAAAARPHDADEHQPLSDPSPLCQPGRVSICAAPC